MKRERERGVTRFAGLALFAVIALSAAYHSI